MAKKPVLRDENGYRKFGIRDSIAYAAGDPGCNMSFALKGTMALFWTQVMGIIGFICFQFMIRNTEIRVRTDTKLNEDQPKFNVVKALGNFVRNRPAVGATIAAMGMFIGMQGATTAVSVTFQIYFKNTEISGIVQLFAMIPIILFTPLARKMVTKYGKKELSVVGSICSIIGGLGLFIIMPNNIGMDLVIYILCQLVYSLGLGIYSTVSWAMMGDAIDGQDGDNDYFRGTAYYAKTLNKTDLPTADQYYLELRGANSSADVYLNGKHMAHHDGGYSTCRVNLTNDLQTTNLLVIAVDNSANETVYPQMADFTFYGGIYRDVNLVCVNNSHFDLDYYGGPGLKVTPEICGADAKVEIEAFVTNSKMGQSIRYTITSRCGCKKFQTETNATKAVIEIPNVHLWHGRKDPYLYTATVELLENGEVLDTVSTRFGCRTFQIDPDNGFILNGEEYPLRGVSRHQDRWGVGNALLPEHHEEDIDLICEVGCTTIRLAHYQHDQYFYDLCDERGLVIWAEIPYISKHMPTGRENTISQMKELITQNYNHPSIVVWGLSNEISIGGSDEDLLENHRILNDLCHEMDKTRLTTIAAVSMCKMEDPYLQIPDVVSYNHYFGWYGGETSMNGPWFDKFHAMHPTIPIGCSEYGCEALNWHTSNPMQGDYTEEYQAYYHEELIKQLFPRKYMWATHVWNMFDFGADARNEGGENGQNHKGLFTLMGGMMDVKFTKEQLLDINAKLNKIKKR